LGNEYKLYNTALNAPKLNEVKAEILISTIVDQARKLNRERLDKEKYNLIREIKSNYEKTISLKQFEIDELKQQKSD
jgi:hypothetical protein